MGDDHIVKIFDVEINTNQSRQEIVKVLKNIEGVIFNPTRVQNGNQTINMRKMKLDEGYIENFNIDFYDDRVDRVKHTLDESCYQSPRFEKQFKAWQNKHNFGDEE